ncbi:hypothetical protein [Wenyingzhuangia aestuarii]|uniref:hypothetical protein n=1 Tax=Wenyingzhuangia aestuarii TaxID=1647582 RepID=UPI00143C442D|nr:hypothetical protein [Wenyingzhuangia aestuarii]NJB83966.1 hypothetical protein [Wenyingzhuangia aestuarii]
MTKYLLPLFALILLVSCSSPLQSVKGNVAPHKYKRPLIVTNSYYSTKSGFAKTFSRKIKNYEQVSEINASLAGHLQRYFLLNNTQTLTHFVNVEIGKNLVLNSNENKEIKTIRNVAYTNSVDLIIKIIPVGIHTKIDGISSGIAEDQFSGPSKFSYANAHNFDYLIIAEDAYTHREVWKAKYDVNGVNSLFGKMAKKIAKKVHKQLLKDRIF